MPVVNCRKVAERFMACAATRDDDEHGCERRLVHFPAAGLLLSFSTSASHQLFTTVRFCELGAGIRDECSGETIELASKSSSVS